jgi:hypothetical protein
MIKLTTSETEFFNNETNEFFTLPSKELRFEYSLSAISKWERKTHKTYFTNKKMSNEEFLSFIACMDLDENTNPIYYTNLSPDEINKLVEYIQDPMTGRTPAYKNANKKGPSYMTSEDFYFSMAQNGIPFECENWHFNRLLALLKYCSVHGEGSGKKMSKKDTYAMYSELNSARKKALGTKG